VQEFARLVRGREPLGPAILSTRHHRERLALSLALDIDAVGLQLEVPVVNRLSACDVNASLTLPQAFEEKGQDKRLLLVDALEQMTDVGTLIEGEFR
jgi:hypothetical protein